MDVAWELGITTFDTADAYGGGRSESFIGEWLATKGADVRDRIVIATKTFNPMDTGQDHGLGRARIRRQIETSLRRLGIERVALYLAHDFDPDDAAGGDAAGVRRPRRARQGRRRRRVELHRRAARRGARAVRARGAAAVRVGAERLLAARPGRPRVGLPGLPRARPRLHAFSPLAGGLADGQVPPRRAAAGRLADDAAARAVRGVHDATGCSTRSRRWSARPRRAGRLDGGARARVGCSRSPS